MASRFSLAALAAVILGSCSRTAPPASKPDPKPRFELRAGEKYSRVNDQPAFVLGRNPVGMNPKAYDDHFRHAAAAGEQFMRIHFTFSPAGEKAGEIDAAMLKSWDEVLNAAEKHGLALLPALGVWADWNDGSRSACEDSRVTGSSPSSLRQDLRALPEDT